MMNIIVITLACLIAASQAGLYGGGIGFNPLLGYPGGAFGGLGGISPFFGGISPFIGGISPFIGGYGLGGLHGLGGLYGQTGLLGLGGLHGLGYNQLGYGSLNPLLGAGVGGYPGYMYDLGSSNWSGSNQNQQNP